MRLTPRGMLAQPRTAGAGVPGNAGRAIDMSGIDAAQLTGRQAREREYHRAFAERQAAIVDTPVAFDVTDDTARRPWNAYWSLYDLIIAAGLGGKRVLLPGCGFGADAIRLAHLGADVSAFDLSEESIDIARQRAARHGHDTIDFAVMPSENLTYADSCFDAVVFVDILHHVDIAATMQEIRRVLKPGGLVLGDELYTHSSLQKIRDSRLVAGPLYRVMRRWIYGEDVPYITEDEHKIDERELAIVSDAMQRWDADYFGIAEGRLFPSRLRWASRIDRSLIRIGGRLAPMLGGRVVFSGTLG